MSSAQSVGRTFSFSVPIASTNEILRRYVKLTSDAETTITLLAASSENCHGDSQRGDIDALVHCLLRGSDLSVPLGATSSIIMARSTPSEAKLLVQRYANAWIAANRNRPRAEVPTLELSIIGSWHVPEERGELLTAIDHLVGEPALLPA